MSGPAPAVAQVRLAVRGALDALAPGDLVLVACSGGPDSLALAAALAFEAPRAGLRAGAVTIDHGLQEGSAERAEQVAETLRKLGLGPVDVVAVAVGTDGGPEAAARKARYQGMDEAAERLGASAVLLGHTQDDQAETVLLGLARGSGARALSGMAARTGQYLRPLLELPRSTVRAACEASGLTPWDDPHNADAAFARSRVRHDVLPVLEDALGPGLTAALARSAKQLRDDADALDQWAEYALESALVPEGGLSIEVLDTFAPAVRRRVLRRAIVGAGSPAGAVGSAHIEAVDRFVTHWRGQGPASLPGGVVGWRDGERLYLAVAR
jgi:tRNA(Ile)-lysidine synthase